MRKIFIAIALFYGMHVVQGQQAYRDSLKNLLASTTNDTTKLICLNNLFYDYLYSYPDSAIVYVQQEILLAEKTKSDLALAKAYIDYDSFFEIIGDFPQALRYIQEALKLAEKLKDWLILARAYNDMSGVYFDEDNYDNALLSSKKAKSTIELNWKPHFEKDLYSGDFTGDTIANYNFIVSALAEIYEKRNQLDSALSYVQFLYDETIQLNGKMDWSIIPYYYGNIYVKKNDYVSALKNYHWGNALAEEQLLNTDIMKNSLGIAKTYRQIGAFDSSVFYANRVIEVSQFGYNPLIKLEALNLLAAIYKSQNKTDSATKYFEFIIATKDSLFGQRKNIQLQSLRFDEQIRQQNQVQQQIELQNKIKFYSLLAALLVFFLIGFLLYRNNRHKQKANVLLTEEKQKVESTLAELKSTQFQLIQSEKMASLGELTAGIAYEIQNPLNFVNNFSEVNKELISEMNSEIEKGNYDEVKALAKDIEDNEDKINHHGRRADAIVKGMLQHSRISSGVKEPTDINALAGEYLRLAYHGLRAKDNLFNATMKTDYDETIGYINIVPQDIGRVLLNLYNNAFYAVTEKKKQADDSFTPTISVSTRKLNDKIEIRVKDNGSGIARNVIDKIFQPFFTTKPTGQGTGLGLSLSYDIVKAHAGEITVNSLDEGFTEFVIYLPV